MIKVYQTLTVENDQQGNCMNAVIASILEMPLRNVAQILPKDKGDWTARWRVWLAEHGYRLSLFNKNNPPKGYSIVSVYTDRVYPEGHLKAGIKISHSCVAFNGIIVHDPYPLPSETYDIQHYQSLKPLTDTEKYIHEQRMSKGKCIHGYLSTCIDCTLVIE